MLPDTEQDRFNTAPLTREEYVFKNLPPQQKILEFAKARIYSNYVKNGGEPFLK